MSFSCFSEDDDDDDYRERRNRDFPDYDWDRGERGERSRDRDRDRDPDYDFDRERKRERQFTDEFQDDDEYTSVEQTQTTRTEKIVTNRRTRSIGKKMDLSASTTTLGKDTETKVGVSSFYSCWYKDTGNF